MSFSASIRPAVVDDANAISKLMAFNDRAHRHLDWSTPIQRLGEQSYWVLEQDSSVQAALSCPEDPPGVAWIRFFAVQPGYSLNKTFHLLFDAVMNEYTQKPGMIVSVAVQTWFLRLLMEQNFQLHQTIVVLQLDSLLAPVFQPDPKIRIRPILHEDLDEVTRVDHEAFDPIWRYSQQDIRSAFTNSTYSTIALRENDIVGYQISSSSPFNAHLARLAVTPSWQGKGIGKLLTSDMIRYFTHLGTEYITVNTQSDNTASLNVYKKLGFSLTGEKFPVMRYTG